MRFPEFEGEWEEKELGVVSEISSGGTPSRANPSYWDGNIPWVSTGLIDFNTIYQTEEKITEEGLQGSSAKLLPNGSLLMAMYGQGKTRGKVAILGIDAATNQACASIRPYPDVLTSKFLFYNLSKRYDEIRDLSNQGSQENLNGAIIKGIKLAYPLLSEQKRVTEFLSLIDERISTQSKIIEKYESLIRGLNNRMFCQNKDAVPKLRFPGFLGKWNDTTIGKILKIGNGRDYKHLDNGLIPVFGTGGYMTSVDDYLYEGDSVCIGRKGTINSPLFLSGKFWTVDTLFYTHSFKNVLPRFCFYVFNHINWLKYNEASGVPSLSKTTIESIQVSTPSVREQEKISEFLTFISDKIELEKSVLLSYKKQKNYLLQNLFV